ncbi:MAG: ABC transporter substrate-binding protein [Spirochaetales bacterium]|nr:ABC transporter substrate-binding protein [Spirochaetales bacterium]
MKKALTFLAVLAVLFFSTGCEEESDQIKVGISKIVAHPALDALEQGIVEVVSESFPEAEFDLQNANGEVSTASSIAQKFKAGKVDAAVGIATPTAQALVQTISEAPVIFSAVTDPVGAGLISSLDSGDGNVTGVSDMIPVYDQIKLLKELTGMTALGHVYTSSEDNASALAALVEEACRMLEVEFVPSTVSNSSEVKLAAQAIASRVDAFYVTTDNTVVSALTALTDVAADRSIPVFSADPTSVEAGNIFMAWGFDYYKMGKATGRLLVEILNGADPATIPTQFMTDPSDIDLYINMDVAKELNIDVPADLQENASTLIKGGVNVKE